MIISVHVPKTGGTTFLDFLYNNFSKNIVSEYYILRSLKDDRKVKKIPSQTKVIHIHNKADKYDKLYPNAKYLIWFRDPIERYLSLYYDFMRRPDFKNKQCKLLYDNDGDINFFVKKLKVDSLVDFMGSKRLSDFSFIGITEMYSKSIQLFCKMFGIRFPSDLKLLNSNPNNKIGNKYKISPRIKNHLKAVLKDDILLYNEAKKIFYSELKKYNLYN